MIMRYRKYFTAIALLSMHCVYGSAHSHNPKNPAPLGPGINKGNIDNKENGPNYYYFYAGPGHMELHYGFKEMGVFRGPLKQALSFDLYDDNNKLIVHNAIVRCRT